MFKAEEAKRIADETYEDAPEKWLEYFSVCIRGAAGIGKYEVTIKFEDGFEYFGSDKLQPPSETAMDQIKEGLKKAGYKIKEITRADILISWE